MTKFSCVETEKSNSNVERSSKKRFKPIRKELSKNQLEQKFGIEPEYSNNRRFFSGH
jgi:hypothetical protein